MCRTALRRAPVAPSTGSARSTKSGSGMRRPTSIDATVCLERPTRAPNSSRLRPTWSRRAWMTAPKVRRLFGGLRFAAALRERIPVASRRTDVARSVRAVGRHRPPPAHPCRPCRPCDPQPGAGAADHVDDLAGDAFRSVRGAERTGVPAKDVVAFRPTSCLTSVERDLDRRSARAALQRVSLRASRTTDLRVFSRSAYRGRYAAQVARSFGNQREGESR